MKAAITFPAIHCMANCFVYAQLKCSSMVKEFVYTAPPPTPTYNPPPPTPSILYPGSFMGRRNQPGNEATPPILKENKGRMDNTKQTTYIVMTLHYFYTISYNVLCHFANYTLQTSNLHA